MRSVLIITYYWPPSGGAAVQRWLSLSNELTKLGWKVWVLTVDDHYATYQLYDESLVKDVHPDTIVLKTKTIEPFALYKLIFGKKSLPAPGFANESNPSFIKKIARFLRGNLFIPDPRKYWRKFALKAAEQVIKKHQIGVVVTAGPPHSTHFIGKDLKSNLGVRWVADFHDLWTDVIYYDMLFHLPIVKRKDLALEKQILLSADAVTTVGEKYKQKLLSKIGGDYNEKINVIRIGYDADFVAVTPGGSSNGFTIAYVGSIADYYKPEVFFKAVAAIKDENPQLNMRFVGLISPDIKLLVRKYKLDDRFVETGYVSHSKAVAEMKSASALLLINPKTKDEPMVIPGKIYEYLAVGKPIINITDKQAETADLIRTLKCGQTFDRTEVAELAEYITSLINSSVVVQPHKMEIQKHSQSEIAKQLQTILQTV